MPVINPKQTPFKSKYQHYTKVNYRGYLLYTVVLVFVFLSLMSLPFISVDVSVQSSGVIRSFNKKMAISAPLSERVKQIFISENSKVQAGDTLLVLQQQALDKRINNNLQQRKIQSNYVDDLNALLSGKHNTHQLTPLYQKQLDEYDGSLVKLDRKIQKLRVDFQRTSDLYKDGVLPLSTFQEDSFLLNEAQDELLSYQTLTKARWEEERKEYVLSINELENRVENLKHEKNKYLIVAPLSGSIINFNGVAAGNFVNENEPIAYLSPEEELVVDCYVSPSDIAFIKEGMTVRFQVHAYDYNQWGLLESHVFDVADDVTLYNGQYCYLVRCRFKKDYLELKNGVRGSMKKGMSLTGRFIITQRTLFQLLFDKVDDWMNPKIQTDNDLNLPSA